MCIHIKYAVMKYVHFLLVRMFRSVLLSDEELKEEFEDTKGAIGIRISKMNIQNNGQKNNYKRTNNDLQKIHIKLKME